MVRAATDVMAEDLRQTAAADLPWSALDGRTVLVSGANGFLASYLVELMLHLNRSRHARPSRVVALVRDLPRARARFAAHLDRTDLELIAHDVCTPLTLDQRVDFVIHAASQASPRYYGIDPVGTLGANSLGTHHLLDLARQHDASGFLFFSSSEVYGQVGTGLLPLHEDAYGYLDPLDVRSCYAESKRMGETMCVSWHHQYGVPVRIVRPFHTYGPGMRLEDGRVHEDFVADILAGRSIVVRSGGQAVRSFCYLADAAAGFLTVMLKGVPGQAYNVGDDRDEVTVLELAKLLVELFPEANLSVEMEDRPLGTDYLPSPVNRSQPDITKVRQLGWAPTTSLADGFTRTVRSFG